MRRAWTLCLVAMNLPGGGGYDLLDCTTEAFQGATKAHLQHGATSIFPTIVAPDLATIERAAVVCEEVMKEPNSPVLGLHI